MVLSKRLLTNSKRMPAKFAVRLGAIAITGILLATLFWQLDDSPSGVQERIGCTAISISTIFFVCMTELPTFFQERYIFMRETAYNAYRRFSYVLARSLNQIPTLFVLSLTFSLITFWAVGFNGGMPGFFFYLLAIFVSFWAGNSFIAFLSGLIPDEFLAFVCSTAIISYFLLLSGFVVSHGRIPKYWLWLHYMSLLKYPFEAILQNEFNDPANCFVRGAQIFDQTELKTLPSSTKSGLLEKMGNVLNVNITSSTCLRTGKDVVMQLGITELTKWDCLWITIAFGFFFRILFYLTLLFGSKNKRK